MGNDHQFTKLPSVKQILLVSAIVFVKRKSAEYMNINVTV